MDAARLHGRKYQPNFSVMKKTDDELFDIFIKETASECVEPFNDPSHYDQKTRARYRKKLFYNMWVIKYHAREVKSEIIQFIKKWQ